MNGVCGIEPYGVVYRCVARNDGIAVVIPDGCGRSLAEPDGVEKRRHDRIEHLLVSENVGMSGIAIISLNPCPSPSSTAPRKLMLENHTC
jgi:hypothetical protein